MKRFLFAMLFALASTANATSWFVYDIDNLEPVSSNKSETTRSIASITKLMTAIVTLDYDQDLKRQIYVRNTHIGTGWRSRGDLLHAMLIKSDNQAAYYLADDYPGGVSAFVAAMNARAISLGMDHAEFADSSGLLAANQATATDVAILSAAASTYKQISDISTKTQAAVPVSKTRSRVLQNTNYRLLSTIEDVVVSKTGFTSKAGYCVTMMVEHLGRRFIVVVLGAPSKQQRYALATQLINTHIKQ